MKFIPNETFLLVREIEADDAGSFARGEVIGIDTYEPICIKGTIVVYNKADRCFLGMGFPNDFVIVEYKDVVGMIRK